MMNLTTVMMMLMPMMIVMTMMVTMLMVTMLMVTMMMVKMLMEIIYPFRSIEDSGVVSMLEGRADSSCRNCKPDPGV